MDRETTTRSNYEVGDPLLARELMFKAEGDKVEKTSRRHVSVCGYPLWLTVVTGPKGSYREEHILSDLATHLEPWTEDREWRILCLEAHAPQTSDNARRLACTRGYLVVIHGGGATLTIQTNDADVHQRQRRLHMEKDIAAMLRILPGKMPSPVKGDLQRLDERGVVRPRAPRPSAERLHAHWRNERVGWETI